VLPKYHALAAAVATVPFARAGHRPHPLALFASAAVLIDVDHYLGYAWHTGDLSLRRAYAFHRQRYHRPRRWRFRPGWPSLGVDPARAFHSAPFLLLIFLLARHWRHLSPVAWGLLFHRLQDELYGSFS
jgi:hypothetical protein